MMATVMEPNRVSTSTSRTVLSNDSTYFLPGSKLTRDCKSRMVSVDWMRNVPGKD